MDDYIKRSDADRIIFHEKVFGKRDAKTLLKMIPSADVAPVRHEEDGTLWVTVGDCEKVGRVIAKNEQGHFCMVFYMGDGDEEPVRHGRWIGTEFDGYAHGFPVYNVYECSECGMEYDATDDGEITHNYCPNCGAKMDEESKDAE